MNILILEDETPAYKKLVNCLNEYFVSDFNHRHVRSVEEGIKVLNETDLFDLIFSDIKLLDGSSFEIFESVISTVPVIFCTAYDEHLLRAFKTNGVAYILKPFSQIDIENALDKYKALFRTNKIDQSVIDELKTLVLGEQKNYKKRFAIKRKKGIFLIETEQISYIEAFSELSKLIDINGNVHISSTNIGKLITSLDPGQFFRINRSQVINIIHIQRIEPYTKNRLAIFLTGQKSAICTSSAATKSFRKWLER